ncbi:MAG: aminoacyl-histidine dipeptidase, partial [Clostridia bacterium]|nr:aminoacyl-histidine dipeptidase [Clostridia bacterium]
VEGGLKDNAIPRISIAKITLCDEKIISDVCQEMTKIFKNEYSKTDSGVYVKFSEGECEIPMDSESTEKIINALCISPNGIIEMSQQIEGLVQTSLNLGILKTEKDEVILIFGLRSSIESQKGMLCQKLSAVTDSLGGKAEFSGDYPGWEYREKSPVRDLMVEVFKERYNAEPTVKAVHAGLECGVFSGKIKDLDAISIGVDMKDIHTFSERLYIKSTERVYKMLLEVLKRMK